MTPMRTDSARTTRSLMVVVVLYRLAPEESDAFNSLEKLLQQDATLAQHFSCIVYDNSPTSHTVPSTGFPCVYVHDDTNPGLARAYQYALEHATREEATWLLLLDQDTVITSQYLHEAVALTEQLRDDRNITAIAPKLLQGSELMLSPHWPSRHPNPQPLRHRTGILEEKMKIFNSGAILRRSDLEAIGGFPQDFPLDFLDHATFHRLQDRGGRTYLMDSTLQHNLSSLSVDLVREFSTSRRTQMIINAESRFYLRYGSPRDVVIYFLRRGKLFMRMMIAGQPRSACAVLRQTFFPS